MSEDKRARRPRRPTLRSALAAARADGRSVKSARQDPDGTIHIEFGEPTADGASDDWDKKLEELGRGKHS